MAWTYDGTPGTATAAERRDAVRLAIGDTDPANEQVSDGEISYALARRSDSIELAAALLCRTLAAKYANLTSARIDGITVDFAGRQKHYMSLALKLESDSAEYGGALGTPVVGGVSRDGMDAVESDTDRPEPAFRRRQFRNPPDDGDYDSREDYLS